VGGEFSFLDILFPYLVLLFGSVISFLFSFNHVLLTADQRHYIVSITNIITKLAIVCVQLLILFLFPNFVAFVSASTVLIAANQIGLNFFVRKLYPYLRVKTAEKLSIEETKTIKTKIKALLFHKIGMFFVNGIDNIVISVFLTIVVVGQFNNYQMLSTQVFMLMTALFAGLGASFGSVMASSNVIKTKESLYNAKMMFLIIFTVITSCLFVVGEQFLAVWIGPETLLPFLVLLIWTINIFIQGYTEPLGHLRFAAGIFEPDKYLHIALPIIKLVIAVVLVHFVGVAGVLIGSLVCLLIKEVTVLPQVVYKHIFKESRKASLQYYKKMLLDVVFVGSVVTACYFLNRLISTGNNIADLVLGGLLCVGVSLSAVLLVFFRTKEMKYLFQSVKGLLKRNKKNASGTKR